MAAAVWSRGRVHRERVKKLWEFGVALDEVLIFLWFFFPLPFW